MATQLQAPHGFRLRYCELDDAGHPGEYIVGVHGANHQPGNYISSYFERLLKQALPEFEVSNRGTRIELVHRGDFGRRDDAAVVAAVAAAAANVADEGLPLLS
jgi:hypothetical protein